VTSDDGCLVLVMAGWLSNWLELLERLERLAAQDALEFATP